MIWVTLRQFRGQAYVAGAVLVVFAVLLGATGPGLAHLYDASGLRGCRAPSDCQAMTTAFLGTMKADGTYPLVYFLSAAVTILAPALIGAFWGAPLIARESEAHTLRLAWFQSVTRTRWTAVKLAVLGLAGMVFAGLLSLMTTWWSAPIDDAGGFPINQGQFSRFAPQIFASRGVAPLGYAAFAFVLGVTAGVLIKRAVPAMAVTLAVFAAVQIAVPVAVRPDMVSPVTQTSGVLTAGRLQAMSVRSDGTLTVPVNLPGAWIVSNDTVTPNGQVFSLLTSGDACQTKTEQQCTDWLATQNLRQAVTYQPAGRYWRFQWYETAIYLILTAALATFTLIWIRRGHLA